MKAKKILSVLLSIVMLISTVPFGVLTVFGAQIVDSGTCGDNLTWTLDNEGTLIISGTGKMDEYSFFITDSPFAYDSRIKCIIIERGVTSIGEVAFYYCKSLTSVNISDTVKSIGACSFGECSSLTSVNIPNSVTSIGGEAFMGCYSLKSVNVPNSVKNIEEDAFRNCSSLISINIPESVTSIGVGAFSRCSSLVSILVSPGNNVYHSEGNCLIETKSKTLVFGCKNSVIPSDGSVTRIGEWAFPSCSFTSVNIPDTITSIGKRAFDSCSLLTSVNIPDSVTSIGEYAFAFSPSLTMICISNSVTNIDYCAFGGCENLTDVYYTGSEKDWNNIEIEVGNELLTNAAIHYNHTHTWNFGVVTKQPTTTSEGVKTYTCTVCGQIKTESISKLKETVIDTATVKEKDGSVYAAPELTAADVIKAAGTGAKILKVDGTQLKETEKVGSGMTLVKADGTKETIIVKGDTDGNGEISTSDARFALRAAVGLENPNDWEKNAGDTDGKTGISTSDARLILRCAVGLEALKLY